MQWSEQYVIPIGRLLKNIIIYIYILGPGPHCHHPTSQLHKWGGLISTVLDAGVFFWKGKCKQCISTDRVAPGWIVWDSRFSIYGLFVHKWLLASWLQQGHVVWPSGLLKWKIFMDFRNFRLAILMAAQSCPGALHVYAPVCSSWTRISRGTSWRSSINVFGDLTSAWVRSANLMLSRPVATYICCSIQLGFCHMWYYSMIYFPFICESTGGWPFCFSLPLRPIQRFWWSNQKALRMYFPTILDSAGFAIGFA